MNDSEDKQITKFLEGTKNLKSCEKEPEDCENYHKQEFRKPRNTLLSIVGEFILLATRRLDDLSKKSTDGGQIELLDSKCHIVSIFRWNKVI